MIIGIIFILIGTANLLFTVHFTKPKNRFIAIGIDILSVILIFLGTLIVGATT